MLIEQIKLDYKRIIPLRNLDMVTKQTVSIIFYSDNEPTIDIGLLHLKHQAQGQAGLRYHYVIKNKHPYDGTIYYCRPRIYQAGIDGHVNDCISNSISICLAGAKGQNATEGQIESCISIAIWLISQENLPLGNVKFSQQIVGNGDIPNWQDIIKRLKERVDLINIDKGLIDLPTTENGVLDATGFGTIITNSYLNTVARISKATGIPQNILIDMNKNISFGTNIPPDTVVYIPKGEFLQRMKFKEQQDYARNVISRIEQEVIFGEAMARGKYGQSGINLYTEDLTFLTTQYGGKKAPPWLSKGLDLPGYHNAFIQITNTATKKVEHTIAFILSPSSSSESRSNSQQMTKTNAGWFIQRTGKNPANLTISGYMMDAKGILEKHEFLEKYKKYIEDTKNVRFEYSNPYSVKIRLEGRDFYGYMQNISFSKSANQPYLYQYNITFLILNDKYIYDEKQAATTLEEINRLKGTAQYKFIPKNEKYTPGQTPVRSRLPDVFATPPVTEKTVPNVFPTLSVTTEIIGSKFYKTVEKANVDMNLVTPISYTPSTVNPGKNT